MNLLEMLKDAISPLTDGEKPPLHVGEVMNLWFYLTATEQTMRGEQVALNTVSDPELREKVMDIIHNVHTPIREEVKDFLRQEGVPLPQSTPDKSLGDFRQISDNAKLSDEEVANLLSFNLVLGINYACRGLTEAVRPDVASMFAKFQMKKAGFAVTFRHLMIQKGWLLVPPYYNQPPTGSGN
ncbi:hypothetical protein FHS18_006595 [Paenibacillus phyllosphaerae]|uniref:DUF3231 family protein n=1 Tax=Paenibacillus phyllosphaerae TaxID=274593 RepID=A0A7W5B5D0_9BACL|nr:DUF3231 family protein [Paenibacillus phyllosphaerae]MBB3114474.1 hypothetical protein [Paenibacillus phyllosphaerae]